MKMLGKSRGIATLTAIMAGLALTTVPSFAHAQISPTGVTNTQPQPKTGGPTPGTNPAPAAPAKAPADPRALLASGEKKLKAGDNAGALADFEASNAAKESPEANRFIGQAQDALGHPAEAVAAYEKFLANVPASMKAQGDETKKRVEAIKSQPGKVHAESTPPGAHLTVDPQPNVPQAAGPNESTPPTPTDIDLPPGKHVIRFALDGYSNLDKEVEVTYGQKVDLKVELQKDQPAPAPPPPVTNDQTTAPPPPPPPPEPRSKIPAYVTGAVAIVAAGIGTGFGVVALGKKSDFDKTPTTGLADDGENAALVADMMFGIAITFGVTSAVLFLSGDAPAAAKADPATKTATTKKPSFTITPAPYITQGGGGAGAVVRF